MLLGYKPVQHVTVLNTVGNCKKVASVIIKVKVMISHYRPGVFQRVGRGVTLHFHDRGTRSG